MIYRVTARHQVHFLADEFQSLLLAMSVKASYIEEPNILIGEVPIDDEESFPFIAVSALSGSDTDEAQTVEVNIVCGVYTTEHFEAGLQNIQNMVDRCDWRFKRSNQPHPICFRRPVDWEIGVSEDEHQPHPFYLGLIRTTWTMVRVEEELGYE